MSIWTHIHIYLLNIWYYDTMAVTFPIKCEKYTFEMCSFVSLTYLTFCLILQIFPANRSICILGECEGCALAWA